MLKSCKNHLQEMLNENRLVKMLKFGIINTATKVYFSCLNKKLKVCKLLEES